MSSCAGKRSVCGKDIMEKGYYGKEPFDLKLTVLRLVRNLPGLIAATLAGTLVFGGGYYCKNVLLQGEKEYSAVSVYKVEYVDEPSKSGDYYINEMTWNTYVHSTDFLDAVMNHLMADTAAYDFWYVQSREHLSGMIEAKLDSDLHVPSTIVTTELSGWSVLVAAAVEETMAQEFAEGNREIAAIHVMTPAEAAVEVLPDVRPMRAFVLSAILSGFFAVTVFLILEIGSADIWLPAVLRRRYGLAAAGTLKSRELSSNLAYRFAGKKRAALCAADEHTDIAEVGNALKNVMDGVMEGVMDDVMETEWIPMPQPLFNGESARTLREMDGVLLVVRAGSHAGKPLERVLEYFTEQDIQVTAALLWEADEWLIRAYYNLSKGNKVE